MQEKIDGTLEEHFLSLLSEIDPEIAQRPQIAKAFAERLITFTEQWAGESDSIQAHEAELMQWIEINAPDAEQGRILANSHAGARESGNE